MNATEQLAPLYAIVDRRERDGSMRIVAEFVDPDEAVRACRLMRWAGSPAHVVLITQVCSEAVDAGHRYA